MPPTFLPIRELPLPDAETFKNEIAISGQPAILRGLIDAWPAVQAGRRSVGTLVDYLRRLDSGGPVDAIMTPPQAEGRIFYADGMNGFNFVRNRLSITAIAEQVLRYGAFAQPPAVAAQSALASDCLPGFAAENRLTVVDEDVLPRIWLGNAITTPTHLDEWHNIGCVVAGRRRFTLFPPEQIANLYIGPIDYAPTGAPMSLVSLHEPDLERFPRFRHALAAAVSAELNPGDAIFIPALWWHHVESLEPFNLLVNYWWHGIRGAEVGSASGFDCLALAILNLKSLPPATRAAWRALFDQYIFGSQEGVAEHIPDHRLGILGEHTASDAARRRERLAGQMLKRRVHDDEA